MKFIDNKIVIKKVMFKDVGFIYAIYSDKGVLKNQNIAPMKRKSEAIKFYFKKINHLYIIKLHNISIGLIELQSEYDFEKINFIIKRGYRNRGYMKFALNELLLNYKNNKDIYAHVNPKNLAAKKVLTKVGFKPIHISYNSVFNLYTNKFENEIIYLYKKEVL